MQFRAYDARVEGINVDNHIKCAVTNAIIIIMVIRNVDETGFCPVAL